MNTPINILITDDHKVVTDGLKTILDNEADMCVIDVAHSGPQLIAKVRDQAPDIVLLDISMPDMTGTEAARILIRDFPGVKIMLLTMHDSAKYIVPAIQSGVHGYMLKNVDRNTLVKGVRELYTTGRYYSPQIADKLVQHMRTYEQSSFVVTDREKEVLQLIFEGYTTKEIAEQLHISPRTVETHRKNMLERSGAKSSAHLVHMALKMGILSMQA